jgi:1-acyl-sn-glycerol-3-phosphate acyltransferase
MMPVITRELPSQAPRRGNAFSRWLGRSLLRLGGWRVVGGFPDLPQYVVIIAPHTSNWDFFIGINVVFGLGLRASFLGKHVLFKGPFGALLRWMGGVPIDRRAAHGTVGEAVDAFRRRERFVLGVTPEGTRARVARWKTGFYHIACGANVPIVPVALDYAAREAQIGAPFYPTGDDEGDIACLQAHFAGVRGKNPR